MKSHVLLSALILSGVVHGDIPDRILCWKQFASIESSEGCEVEDCVFPGSDMAVLAVTGIQPRLQVFKLNLNGEVLRKTPLQETDPDLLFTCCRFADDTTPAVAYCHQDSCVSAGILVFNMLKTGEADDISLSLPVDKTEGISIASMEPVAEGGFSIFGELRYEGDRTSLFAAALDAEGSVVWFSELCDSGTPGPITVLKDGGCVLSVSDSDRGELLVYRLDGCGQVLWSSVIQQDADFIEELADIMELENGGFLCIGTVMQSFTLQRRGLLVCIDSSGEDLWRREDWYQDHTSFRSAAVLPDGGYLILGWTAVENSFGVLETDVLLVEVDITGSTASGMQVERPGNQQPFFMCYQGGNEITVAGENTAPGESLSTVFLAHTSF